MKTNHKTQILVFKNEKERRKFSFHGSKARDIEKKHTGNCRLTANVKERNEGMRLMHAFAKRTR